jgi:hypothetical protein
MVKLQADTIDSQLQIVLDYLASGHNNLAIDSVIRLVRMARNLQ